MLITSKWTVEWKGMLEKILYRNFCWTHAQLCAASHAVCATGSTLTAPESDKHEAIRMRSSNTVRDKRSHEFLVVNVIAPTVCKRPQPSNALTSRARLASMSAQGREETEGVGR